MTDFRKFGTYEAEGPWCRGAVEKQVNAATATETRQPTAPEDGCFITTGLVVRQANPCENGGICTVKDKKVKCVCVNGFTGDNCTESDRCINNACANNSTCKNGPRGTYICECLKDTVGTYCQFVCAPDQCSGNGECILRHDGKVGCKCISGMTGPRCDRVPPGKDCTYLPPFRVSSLSESVDLQLDSNCPINGIPGGTYGRARPMMTDEREEGARESERELGALRSLDRLSDPLLSSQKWAELAG
ncbi:unnamed protein product [Heligmosomoides polygyrus]|uniref:EGF-like domain-containing protein n=1 Tax=Heligmosomoides polygyrus TaxID=6339 RepID=A0A3P8F2E4_HELPZ|nr:unnamed protein product [Heligmosomoides polygyrus]